MGMKRLALVLLLVALLVAGLPAAAVAAPAEAPYVTDLVYGRKLVDVGDVKVWNDGDYLYVKYIVTKARLRALGLRRGDQLLQHDGHRRDVT